MAMEVLQANSAAIAAGAGTTTFELGAVPSREAQGTFNLERLTILASAAVTGANTNTGTINVRQLRAGSAVGTLASYALTAGNNLPAEQEFAMTLTGVPQLLAGDVLDVQYVQIGTGLALPAFTVKAEID